MQASFTHITGVGAVLLVPVPLSTDLSGANKIYSTINLLLKVSCIVRLLSRNFGGVGDGADKSTNFFL